VPQGEIILGETQSIDLEFFGDGLMRSAVPRLVASVGQLGDPTQVAPGQYRVRFTPPATKFPQWALIAGVQEDSYGWAAVPLLVRARVAVESEPAVSVVVRLRDAEFGPIVTDVRGRGEVEVIVPPGLPFAESVATDALGNTRHKRIQLGVPRSNRALLYCPDEGESLLVFSLESNGAGSEQPGFKVHSQEVSPQPPEPLGLGVYRVGFRVPEGLQAGSIAKFQVMSADGEQDHCQIKVPLEAPSGMTLYGPEDHVNADGPDTVILQLDWRFPGVRTARKVAPVIEVSLGTISDFTELSATQQRVTWTLPRNFNAQTLAVAKVRYAADPPLSAEYRVKLQPGALKRLELTLPIEPLLANGKTYARVLVHGLDAHGNAVEIKELVARADGSVGAFSPAAGGGLQATYTTRVSHAATGDLLTLIERDSGVQVQARIPLTPRKSRYWIAARAGVMHNFGQLTSPLALIGAGARLPLGDEHFVTGLEAGYSFSEMDAEARVVGLPGAPAAEDVSLTVSGFPVSARLAYQVQLGAVTVYPGVGAGVMLSDSMARSASINSPRSVSVLPLVGGFAGAGVPLGRGTVEFEVGYWSARLDEGFARGNLVGLQATLGYAISP
jgi:hypothetical protein